MIININELHVNNISHSAAAAATQVECTRNLFIYHLMKVVHFCVRGKEGSHEKNEEYLGARESLSHWQGQTPDIWNKLVLDNRDGCFQTQRISLDPWQEPALDNASQGWFNSWHKQWMIDFAGVPVHCLNHHGAALAQGAVAEPMAWQRKLQTSSAHSVLEIMWFKGEVKRFAKVRVNLTAKLQAVEAQVLGCCG